MLGESMAGWCVRKSSIFGDSMFGDSMIDDSMIELVIEGSRTGVIHVKRRTLRLFGDDSRR